MSRDFFVQLNIHNPPKSPPRNWYVRKADTNSMPEFTVCGYEFTLDKREDSFGVAEGASPELNFRRVFLPDEGCYWMSRDFASQELRILANLSGEETLTNAFLHGEDPHKATAIAIWGKEHYSKENRSKAKSINFGLVYGMEALSLAAKINVTVKEAEEYMKKYYENLPSVKRFLDRSAREAAITKDVPNIYGRRRRLYKYLNKYGGLTGGGIRRAYNYPVQSVGAEIIKLSLIKLYDRLITDSLFEGKVKILNTIHDEVNFSVPYDLIGEVALRAGSLMFNDMPVGKVPISSGLEIGHNMGLTWKFNLDPFSLELTPVYEPLKEKE